MQTITSQAIQHEPTKREFRLLANWASILGSLSTLLALYGYCVMQGLADALHLDGGSLWSAPGDVLHYAFLSMVTLLNRLPNALTWSGIGTMITQWNYWAMTCFLAAGVWVVCGTDKSPPAVAERRQRWLNKLQHPWLHRRFGRLAIYQWALVVATALALPLSMIALWFVLMLVGLMFAVVAMIGISNGTAYVTDNSPKVFHCIASPQAAASEPHNAVRCVRVRWQADGQSFVETGILITSTSSYALLLNPETRKARRVPLTGQTILESVDTLEVQSGSVKG